VKANAVKAALRAGAPQVGTWLSLGSVFAARFLSRSGFPWLTVDMEHSHVDLQTAALMFGAIADAGCVPLARVPSCRHDQIKQVLDCGAMGIVVPMVMDADEARLAVAAAKYPPRGNRSVGGSLHALNFNAGSSEYFREADDQILVVLQTEHIDAVGRMDEIYSVEGIDAIFVGPNDLAASMRDASGLPPGRERFEEVLAEILAATRRHGVAAGLHVLTEQDALARIDQGWRFLAVGSDLSLMLRAAGEVNSAMRPGLPASAVARY
jgi:4-hydroxy-2-oxoheptanedioate aldolase